MVGCSAPTAAMEDVRRRAGAFRPPAWTSGRRPPPDAVTEASSGMGRRRFSTCAVRLLRGASSGEASDAFDQRLGRVERDHFAGHGILYGFGHYDLLYAAQLGAQHEGHFSGVAGRGESVFPDWARWAGGHLEGVPGRRLVGGHFDVG